YKYSDYVEPFNNEEPYFSKKNEMFLNKARAMYTSLRSFKNYIKSIKEKDEDYFGKLHDYIDELSNTLVACMTIDEKTDTKPAVASLTVYKFGFEIRLTPLEIADIFGVYLKNCQNNDMGVVLNSATLSVDHNFIKLKSDLGIPKDDVDYIEIPTFFDYEHNAALYTSDRFPEINSPNREKYLWAQVRDFVKQAPGGVFILTTSISALNRLAKIIREDKEQKRKVLCQYENLSNTKMLNAFKEDGNAILIGSISFWAGVDVRGDALSLVIIDKLPFTSPQDPIFSARCRHFEHKSEGNRNRSFMDISIPEAVICLRQGVGRLIRHEKDCGAMVICDPRIKKRGYGNIFLNSLPSMKRINTPQELLKFLHNLGESKHESSRN
ncbi:MAG: ATP-dependent DNA helicase, partial [Succinatimonas sp.]|nr:ATP-dependent DNA helicase [Succinatimonas sp.]